MTEQPSHMKNLGHANQVRAERAHLRRLVAEGALPLHQVVQDEAVGSAKLFDVAQWQRRWGRDRGKRLLKAVGATEYTLCKNLTPRQVEAVQIHTGVKSCDD